MNQAKTDPNGNTSLYRNGHQLNCPYQPALALPGQLSGQIQIMRMPCSSICPMFEQRIGEIHLNCTKTIIQVKTLDVP